MRQRVALFILALSFAVLTACGAPSEPVSTATPAPAPPPTSSPDGQPQRHYEPTGRFSYLPPAGWDLVDSGELAYQVAVGPEQADFSPNLVVLDETFDGSLDDYVAASLTNMGEFFQEFRLIDRRTFRSDDGHLGTRLITENVQGGRTLRQTYYFFERGPTKFVLTCTQLAGAGDNLDATCDASAQTFRLEPE